MQSVDKKTDFDGTLGETPINHDSEVAVNRILDIANNSDDIAGFLSDFGKEEGRFVKSLRDKSRFVTQDREFSLNQTVGFEADVRAQAQGELDSVLSAGRLGLSILQEKDRVKQQKFDNDFKVNEFEAARRDRLFGLQFGAVIDGIEDAYDLDEDEIIKAYQDQGIIPNEAAADRALQRSILLKNKTKDGFTTPTDSGFFSDDDDDDDEIIPERKPDEAGRGGGVRPATAGEIQQSGTATVDDILGKGNYFKSKKGDQVDFIDSDGTGYSFTQEFINEKGFNGSTKDQIDQTRSRNNEMRQYLKNQFNMSDAEIDQYLKDL